MSVTRLCVLVVVTFLLASCSSGPTEAEYAEDVEALVTTMNGRIDQLDVEVDGTTDLRLVKKYATDRVEARSDFVSDFRDLEPPDELVDLHDTAVRIMQRLTVAESALADRVLAMDVIQGVDSIWDTPEGIAARTADDEAVALCLSAQGEFDETANRAELSEVPWIPPAMKEVIVVAFGCIAEER